MLHICGQAVNCWSKGSAQTHYLASHTTTLLSPLTLLLGLSLIMSQWSNGLRKWTAEVEMELFQVLLGGCLFFYTSLHLALPNRGLASSRPHRWSSASPIVLPPSIRVGVLLGYLTGRHNHMQGMGESLSHSQSLTHTHRERKFPFEANETYLYTHSREDKYSRKFRFQ